MTHATKPLFAVAAILFFNTCAFAGSPGTKPSAIPKSSTIQGSVVATSNPLVAQYTLTLPSSGTWSVSFGTTTAYGRSTSVQTASTPDSATSLYVAGMLPNTPYHMQATATLADGTTVSDVDHIFTTGPLPPEIPSGYPVTLGVTGTPQPGIELIDELLGPSADTVLATDLEGNVIWFYQPSATRGALIVPAKFIPNGDLVLFLAPNSYPTGTNGINVMREVDLAGNTVRELSMARLNAGLRKAGLPGTLEYFSHDFTLLPNGHYLIIANLTKQFTDLPGYPGDTTVVGDAIVDLDPDWNPVWIWNEFDHFDVNRHPMNFPDWTHTNSVAYSPTDGNFIVSIRHQDWVVKVDYRDGKGSGDVLWKLGKDGDFALQGGVDPTDWFYAQHDARFIGDTTAGKFVLSVMDNGDDRKLPPGVSCGTGNDPACQYSTIPIMQIDETAKTASFLFHQVLPSYLYSNWGGNVAPLANGNIEYFLSGSPGGSQLFEVTNEPTPRTVWNLTMPGCGSYRAFRLPSLYPGVQW